jgi:hypothetical protein
MSKTNEQAYQLEAEGDWLGIGLGYPSRVAFALVKSAPTDRTV